jgi:putative hydrolase of the HAD superfamily
VLVTNAHQKTLAFKMERTRLAGFFDRVISSHELGLPKEDPAFWPRLHAMMPFEGERTLFVDDNQAVLDAAKAYGIRWLLAVLRPDSKAPKKRVDAYPAIHDFSELMPGLSAFCRAFPESP